MNTKRLSTLVITFLMVFAYTSLSNAEEIVLCINSTDQYIDMVSEKGDCVDGEKQMTIKGPESYDKKNMTPLALFENNEECDTEGSVAVIGFDKNGNNTLDEDEIESVSKDCALSSDEESEY